MNNERVASELVNLAKAIAAGCEKLPAGPMRDNCEKKKEEGEKKESSMREAGQTNPQFVYKKMERFMFVLKEIVDDIMDTSEEENIDESKVFDKFSTLKLLLNVIQKDVNQESIESDRIDDSMVEIANAVRKHLK